MSVGSSAALLVSEELAFKLSDQPTLLYTCGGSHTLRTGDRRPMQIPLLPNETEEDYKELYKQMEREDGRWPGFESFAATRFAAYMAYRMAGIHDPLEDLDLIETHDAFTISDLQTYGDVGLTLYGREQDFVTSGDCYLTNPHTGEPVSVSPLTWSHATVITVITKYLLKHAELTGKRAGVLAELVNPSLRLP